MNLGFLFLLNTLFLCPPAIATNEHVIDHVKSKKLSTEILDKYSAAKFITAAIEKKDEKLTLGTTSSSSGVIKYSLGKFYLILESDKKTELFFKDHKLTLVDYPDQDFDKEGKRKVTIMSNNIPPFLQSLSNLFSSSKAFFKEFEITESALKDGVLHLKLSPRQGNLKDFKIEMNIKDKILTSVSFIDDVQTQTTILFKDLKLNKKIPKNTFEYKILKSDQVVTQ